MVHTGGSRRRGKPRSRILYWFRTPPGVRVGRSALDEEAIRLIEEHNPDVEFDWTRILKSQETGAATAPVQQERRQKPRPARGGVPPAAGRPAPVPAPVQPRAVEPDEDEDEDAGQDNAGVSAEAEDADGMPAVPETPPSTVAEARLGAEGLARLRARHAEVLARITEGVPDPARREELKAQAERLNPDTWVTDVEVAAGLESYESVFDSLRTAIGRRRKRRRSRKPRAEQGAPPAVSDEPADGEDTDPDVG